MTNNQSEYPLLPYSQLVFDMLKTDPDVYYTRFSIRVNKREVDMLRLKYAIETALRNHSVLSMRVDAAGMQHYEPLSDIYHGQYHAVNLCDEGESVRIEVAYNRILGDTQSELIVFEDVFRAYLGLPLSPDYYMAYLEQMEQYKRTQRYEENRCVLEQEFDALTCPVHPKTDIPLNVDMEPIEGTLVEEYKTLYSKLSVFSHEQVLPLTAIILLASALAIMEYNNTNEAALTWAYEGRESEDEQRIVGSLHRDVPFRIQQSNIEDRESAIREVRKRYRDGITHSSYPFTLTKPHTDIWNYALNVLVRPTANDMEEKIPFPFEMVPPANEPNPAYALLDVEIHEQADSLQLLYRYSATHYKPESIRRFADLVRKYVEWLID